MDLPKPQRFKLYEISAGVAFIAPARDAQSDKAGGYKLN